jgi:hypothetical protein
MPVVNPAATPPPIPSGTTAPCGWTIDTTCCPDWDTATSVQRDRATQWATYLLWSLTGRQFGACEVTVRPCGSTCQYYGGWMTYPVVADGIGSVWSPFIRDGSWFNCGCAGACSCEPRCAVWLPGPVAGVVEVVVDGVVIDPSRYRVDNRTRLVGLDGQCWPDCQNMNLESPDEGTFQVTYLRGKPLPMAGQIAAGLLACEFLKACQGQACGLPANISSLTRQGVQIEMVDPTDELNDGLTGIRQVDQFIRAVNPKNLLRRPRVLSPDLKQPAMRTS